MYHESEQQAKLILELANLSLKSAKFSKSNKMDNVPSSLGYSCSARRTKARKAVFRISVPQLKMKFEATGLKVSSYTTMMKNRAPSRWARTGASSKCHLVNNNRRHKDMSRNEGPKRRRRSSLSIIAYASYKDHIGDVFKI